MSANVESMFYAGREKPWHGLGTQVEEAPTSADALRLAGLDWTVQRKPIQVCGGRKVDNFFANVRRAATVRCWAWSVTGIRWCRMRRHLRSPTL